VPRRSGRLRSICCPLAADLSPVEASAASPMLTPVTEASRVTSRKSGRLSWHGLADAISPLLLPGVGPWWDGKRRGRTVLYIAGGEGAARRSCRSAPDDRVGGRPAAHRSRSSLAQATVHPVRTMRRFEMEGRLGGVSPEQFEAAACIICHRRADLRDREPRGGKPDLGCIGWSAGPARASEHMHVTLGKWESHRPMAGTTVRERPCV
jgi:hypothetical protein